jgi:hypothetical protein
MQAYLKKHGPGVAEHRIKVEWEILNREVRVKFNISKRTSKPWLAEEEFTEDWSKNWGLWNTDVIEAFIQLRKTPDDLKAPYLEVQLSPLNQPFALVIIEPRKTFHAPAELEFTHSGEVDQRVWSGEMNFTLPNDLEGDLVYGGFFSCLDHGPREFYALEPNPEENPDFHRPELFLPLTQL